jgi:hypothetical protein
VHGLIEDLVKCHHAVRFAQGGQFAAHDRDNNAPRKIEMIQRRENFVNRG